LFDVGGPIDEEVELERLVDRDLRSAIRSATGREVSEEAFLAAERAAIVSFAPNAYRAIVWTLCEGRAELARGAWELFATGAEARDHARGGIELRPGIAALIRSLASRGVALGLAANQPKDALKALRACALGDLFGHFEVAGTLGLRKPDPRVFLAACDALGVSPEDAIMIGDRVDNDIAPARTLGLVTIRFVCGRHRQQAPRSWDEVPDHEVSSVEELASVLNE
jgi:HAD superfamily hydrolase (TIGR01549 family)